MKIESELSPKQYLSQMRRQMGAFSSFLEERFTGIFWGHFFYVTYHSGWEWNRRITNEKNRAIGVVREDKDGSKVCCVCFRGMTDPLSLAAAYVFYCLLCWIVGWFYFLRDPGSVIREFWLPFVLILSSVVTLVNAIATAIYASVTERGIWGRYMLMALLRHPEDPQNNIEEC